MFLRLPLAVATTCLALAGAVRAGVYNFAEQEEFTLSPGFDKFRDTLLRVKSVGFPKVEIENTLRKRYLLWDALGEKADVRALSLEQTLQYSAVLIRRKKGLDAVRLLDPLVRKHPDNFLLQSHLAQAHWTSGQPGSDRRAFEAQGQMLAKSVWPLEFAGLTEDQRKFLDTIYWDEGSHPRLRRCEALLHKLMRLRLAEGPGAAYQNVDALFDEGGPIRFVGESGSFEPGKVVLSERKKLPSHALDDVQQLLLWIPEDLRLYWLLGEIYNAQGTPNGMKAAGRIFDELVFDYKLRAGDLRERRQRLLDHLASLPAERAEEIGDFEKRLDEDDKKKDRPLVAADSRTLATTFAFGFCVGLFALWQFQELRRRRQGK